MHRPKAPSLRRLAALATCAFALSSWACASRHVQQREALQSRRVAPSPHEEALQERRVTVASPAPRESAAEPAVELQAEAAPPSFSLFGRRDEGPSREAYDTLVDNPFVRVHDQPLSTFSVDVDTAAYANVRRLLRAGALPPPGAVRVEEMINYFDYQYPQPAGEHPFHVEVEVARAPWNPANRLLRIGLKGRDIEAEQRSPSNLVFLLDVSGSMAGDARLGLVKRAMARMVEQLDERDTVSMVVYAGASGVVLEPTPGSDRHRILSALDRLAAGGSTNGGQGIELAYRMAQQAFVEGGTNRVVLATDGDFNVGVSDRSSLVRLIEEKARSGVYLTILGVGMGNYQDATLEELSNKGDGNYAYLDSDEEARKVLVDQLAGTLITIAKDVKLQVELNPLHVGAYRLIGYENRALAAENFNDDKKDAGDIGAGHTVTALYELMPRGADEALPGVDALRYQSGRELESAADSLELATVKLRYKQPEGGASQLLQVAAHDDERGGDRMSEDFRFAAAVAGFGMLLRGSPHKGDASYASVAELARSGRGRDAKGYRAEMIELVETASRLR